MMKKLTMKALAGLAGTLCLMILCSLSAMAQDTEDACSPKDNFQIKFGDKVSATTHALRILDRAILEEEDEINTQMVVFPNPVTDVFQIQLNNAETVEQVRFMTLTGAIQLSEQIQEDGNALTFNIGDFPTGIYLMQVLRSDGSTTTTKIIKN